MDFFSKPFINSKERFDDFNVYQMLCDHLSIHQSKRKALFGVDDFYKHALDLLTREENLDKVEQVKNTCLFTRFIS